MSHSDTCGEGIPGKGVKYKGDKRAAGLREKGARPPHPSSTLLLPPQVPGEGGAEVTPVLSLFHHSTLSPGRSSPPLSPW